MDEDPSYWREPYSSPYNPMANNDHYMESGDYYTHITDLADIGSFVYPPVSTNFPQVSAPSNDTSLVMNPAYPTPGNTSTRPRQQAIQQLHINTQLSPFQFSDISESSAASSSSLPNTLQTPYFQLHPGLQPSVRILSPQSAPVDGRMLLPDFENKSPLSALPLPSNFEGDSPVSPLPADQDVVRQLPMPHILEWKKVIERCGTNDFVPQVVYQPFTEADRKRYIRDVVLHETIFFQSNDSSELGISLDDALKQRLKHLKDKDDLMFAGCGPSVSIRIQWPGYVPWSKQIPTMDFRNPKGPITRAKLAKNIATCIERFAKEVQDKPMEAESDPRWKIGKRHIEVKDIILVSLHHVSKGSWQPQLRLRSPSTTFSYEWSVSLPVA